MACLTDYPIVYPVEEVLTRASEFFEGRGAVHRTAESIAKVLREEGIAFAIAGALALGAHGVRRDSASFRSLEGEPGATLTGETESGQHTALNRQKRQGNESTARFIVPSSSSMSS